MQESKPKLSLNQCREIVRVRCEQLQQLVESPSSEKESINQISDAFTQTLLGLADHIDDEDINKNIDAFMKAYDTLAVRLGIRPYISEVEDADEGEPENPVDEE
jgi:hypothetical protein